jgi:energy-coupling factor transporter ATP-binding protein EcfA2
MRLKSVFISQYKNLRNFSLDFDGTSFIDVFVGKNGSGKSNLFEALIEIFRHLVEFVGSDNTIGFDYRIAYEIEGKEVRFEWRSGRLAISFDGKARRNMNGVPLPDNLLIYYSGHNNTVDNLIAHYANEFRERLKNAGPGENRWFLGIGPEYKSLLLTMLLLQHEDNPARKYIVEKLGIERLGIPIPGGDQLTEPVIRITLGRPEYARDKKQFDIEQNDETDRYWRAEGVVKQFLDGLTRCEVRLSERFTISEGYFASDERYVLHLSLDRLQTVFGERGALWLFRQFDNLKTLGMLAEISVPLRMKGGAEGNVQFFSDGQFQTVYIYAIVELFKDSNCLMLLDEPDAFLHPEWQFEFLKQIFEISDIEVKRNHLLLSSHSAVTLIPHDRSKIKFFDIRDNVVNCYELPKRVAIQKLSANLIKYSEQEQLLSIINAIQIEKKPVLFTEGSTDPLIIKEAWARLYTEEMPFIPFYAFSCTYIKQLLTDNRIHQEMGGLPIFALFDFDEAYNQWNGLNGTVLQEDPFQGKIKRWQEGESYAFMLPIPDNARIRAQSVHPTTGQTFGGSSCCAIEHLFYGAAGAAAYFVDEPCAGGSRIVFKSDGDKTAFAKEVVPTLPDACFQPLRPMFEFIAGKCRALAPVAAAPRRRRGR